MNWKDFKDAVEKAAEKEGFDPDKLNVGGFDVLLPDENAPLRIEIIYKRQDEPQLEITN